MRKFVVFLLFSVVAYSQTERIAQAELDSIKIYPVTKVKLDNFKMHLEANPGLKGWTYYYNSVAILKYNEEEYDSVIHYQRKAIKYFEESENKRDFDEKKIVQAYYFIGKAFVMKKQYRNAIYNLQRAIDLSEKHPYKWKSYVLSAIAHCHIDLGDSETALRYYKEALTDSLYNSLSRPNITTNSRIGLIYMEESEQKDSAKHYFKKALQKSLNSEYKFNITYIHGYLGDIFSKEGKKKAAIRHYKLQREAFGKFKQNDTYAGLSAEVNYNYSKIESGNYIKPIQYLSGVRDSVKKNIANKQDKNLFVKISDNLILGYSRLGNYDKALQISEEKAKFLEAFHERILNERINDLEIEFQSKQKDKSISRLELITVEQKTILRQQSLINIILIAVFILLVILFWLLIRQKNTKTGYEKVSLEQRLLRSQMNPHFIFNTLNTISALANKKSEKTNTYILKFSNLLRLILNNSREEFVLLNDEITALDDYLTLQSDFNQLFNYQLEIDESLLIEDVFIPPMLIQPFVENSIKHGISTNKNGDIRIKLNPTSDEKLINCTIEDNGIGYSKRKGKDIGNGKKSVSTHIVRERLEIYRKQFKTKVRFNIGDKLDQFNKIIGTTVVISIPYIEE